MHQNGTPQPNHFFDQQRTAKVAVVLPVYNTARYLRECLDSILAQSYKNFVVFAVDDGSTDTSGQILNEYTAKDQRIVTFHKKNGGVSSARNVALDAIGKLFKNPRAKPDGTKMFCSAFLNDARMCCFFANAIVKY